MRVATVVMFYIATMLASTAAHAQIFMCKDAAGRTISSDRPIPECSNRPVREYHKSGVLKREVPAPLTAEEKRQKLLLEEKQKAEQARAEEQRKADRALLERYRSEAGIEAARERSLDLVREQIKRDSVALEEAEKQLKQVQAQVRQQGKTQTDSSSLLDYKVETLERRIKDTRHRLRVYHIETSKINAKFDQTVVRFREIGSDSTANQH